MTLRDSLSAIGQDQVFRFFDSLDAAGKQKLTSQLEALDPQYVKHLAETQVKTKAALDLPKEIKPVTAYPNKPDAKHRGLYADAERRGRELLRAGKVAAFLVAGGQGTRLGYDGPKGEYPVTPVKDKPLFQVFAEQLIAHGREFSKAIPWYIMTSDTNDAATKAFFEKHDYFGLDRANVVFFVQGMMPAFAFDGTMLLAEKDSLALSADGHGGSLRALAKTGALADMRKRGVEHLSYFQVDNPLVHVIDPLFIGLHDLTGSEMSSKAIPKANALEKVGNFVIGDGKTQVIEYSDLPESLAVQTNADGSLKFNTGSIGIHALRVSFVEALNADGQLKLPWHRAEKKVPFVDASGNVVKPEKPNAVKLEQFVFDAIPLAKNAIVYTTERAEEFSPVKNADGVDSPATSRRDQSRRAARWLIESGVEVPQKYGEPDAAIEISPLFAANQQQLAQRASSISVKGWQNVYLE
ncbi:MAG TPA: UDPGP type 1 family protein [Tepidisphaeraceae bacterium]|jgi:UDP-N-acetylglucosamine/UDP-N-acetylgalactosamine diphosphorylase|nr:UDPGP type 1 family protein [Tepidisphaeraceae bacterium]